MRHYPEDPLVQITFLTGRTPELKRELHEGITQTIARILGIPPGQLDRVRVYLYEVPKENVSFGGVPLSELDSRKIP